MMREDYYCDVEAMLLHDGLLWYSPMNSDLIYCLNTFDNSIILFDKIIGDCNVRLFSDVFYRNKKIYFVPGRANAIYVIDLEKNTGYYIPVFYEQSFCRASFVVENRLFLKQSEPSCKLCVVDLDEEKIIKVIEPFDYITSDTVILDKYAYMTSYNRSSILKMNCRDLTYTEIVLEVNENGFGTISYDGTAFWLSGLNSIMKWNEEKNKIDVFEYNIDRFGLNSMYEVEAKRFGKSPLDIFPFWESTLCGNEVILIPRCYNMIICIDVQNGLIKEKKMMNEEETLESILRNTRITQGHYFLKNTGDAVLICSLVSRSIYKMNKSGKITNKFILHRNIVAEEMVNTSVSYEDEVRSLSDFVEMIKVK